MYKRQVLTSVILANDGTLLPNPPNDKIFPTFSVPGNNALSLVTVDIPVDPFTPVIEALPKSRAGLCFTSPLNGLTKPTSPRSGPPYTDFTSCIPKEVTATATLLFDLPFTINGSFAKNSPDFS